MNSEKSYKPKNDIRYKKNLFTNVFVNNAT